MTCWLLPRLFGVEIGFNLPAFVIALVITAILVIGIKESASFNATIVVIKVSVVLFVIGARFKIHFDSELGNRLAQLCAVRIFGNWRGRGVHILCLHRIRCGFDDGAGSEESAA